MTDPPAIPPQFRAEADNLSPVLRALLEAELAAGNQIVGVGHSHPAPALGASFMLANPVTTHPHASGDGLDYIKHDCPVYSGWFTDAQGLFLLLEPPGPPEPEPDMDAIRAAHLGPSKPAPPRFAPDTAAGRFERSMVINYEKWHDGIGYDIDIIQAAGPRERQDIEKLLVEHGITDWRDVEALAALGSPKADEMLRAAVNHHDVQVAGAVARYAPRLVPDDIRIANLVRALAGANLYEGLSQAIDEAAEFHPPQVVDALFRGALAREGEASVNFAALLLYVHGKASAPLDWDQRPFFLRFDTDNRDQRRQVFIELCGKVGVDPTRYL